MMIAQNKNEVMKWGARQLGSKARLISISERDYSDSTQSVEKGGTGITAREANGCQPLMSIMANFTHYASDDTDSHMEGDWNTGARRLPGMRPTVH
jgi:hypothetical protein